MCWGKRNLNSRVLSHGRLTLYIWLGTCDLTYKISRSRSIALRHSSDDECLRYFQHIIQEFQSELVCFSTVKVVWLDIPPYSISMWNIGKGAAPSSADRESDRVLSHRIALVNDIFRSLNQTNSVSSFRFKADLLRTRKVYNKCSRTTVNFNLFKDGIYTQALFLHSTGPDALLIERCLIGEIVYWHIVIVTCR